MNNKLFFITGSRAEFDLIKNLLILLDKSKKVELHLVITATHLSKKYGYTYNYIKKYNFKNQHIVKTHIDKKNNNHNLESISLGINKITKLFIRHKPKLVCVVGDRYEMLYCALSSYFLNIPIAHFFGGEVTYGSLDDGIRHCLTKLSNFHFVTHKKHKNRVHQLGEEKQNIFNINHIGFDSLINTKLYSKKILSKILNIDLNKNTIFIVLHPENLSKLEIKQNTYLLCEVLSKLKNYNLVFNKPNSDNHSMVIDRIFLNYVEKNSNAYYLDNLGHKKYLSLLNNIDFIIGNSSSGLSEMPYFSKPTINIGNRQKGRNTDLSIINCKFTSASINYAIKKANNENFLKLIKSQNNYYKYIEGGSKKVSSLIDYLLEKIDSKKVINKKFVDIF